MPVNRNALIRYRTIDNCLRNRHRKWTLEDLIQACSDALYEFEGIEKGLSRRSVQMDIQSMRSDKLGYNAPIIVLEKKYYTYQDPEYSITNIPLTDHDLGKLTEVVEILRQFKGFSHFQELSGMVQRLENKIYSARTKQQPVIDFEKNENLKGLEHIETIYQAIINKKVLSIGYQSFKSRQQSVFGLHPYWLKEYRNRWFVIGATKRNVPFLTLALDRITSIEESANKYYAPSNLDMPRYYEHVLGVSVNVNQLPEKIHFFADRETAPYIRTKPLHHSQEVVEVLSNGVIFSVTLQLNFELEREILGFGERIRIISPLHLKRRIRSNFENALDQYDTDLSPGTLQNLDKLLKHKGSAILNNVYTKKTVNAIRLTMQKFLSNSRASEHAIRKVFTRIPDLLPLIFNENLRKVLHEIKPDLFLSKAIYFDKSPQTNWYVTWHQDTTINVTRRIDTDGYSGWTSRDDVIGVRPPQAVMDNTVTIRVHLDDTDSTNGALKIVPGSHKKLLNDDEIKLITQNVIPYECNVSAAGIHLMRPMLLHASSKATAQRQRRVLHLEFNSLELPNGLEWSERLGIV